MQLNRMTQEEVARVIELHAQWLKAPAAGARARLENLDLTELTFADVNLSRAVFTNCNLSRCSFARSTVDFAQLTNNHFELADLRGCTGRNATFQHSDLGGANLQDTVLPECDFRDCNLESSNFLQADVTRSTFERSNLDRASFFHAKVEDCLFDSKASLARLTDAFSQEQLESSIFLDERLGRGERVDAESLDRLVVTVEGDSPISPYNTSLLLATINAAYNNLLFLNRYRSGDKPYRRPEHASEDDDGGDPLADELRAMKAAMTPFFQGVGARDDIYITSLRSGSQIYEIAVGLAENFPVLKSVVAVVAVSAGAYTWLAHERRSVRELRRIEAETKRIEAETKKIEQETKKLAAEARSVSLTKSRTHIDFARDFSSELEQINDHISGLRQNPELESLAANMNFASEIVRNNAPELIVLACQPLLTVSKKLAAYGYRITIRVVGPSNGSNDAVPESAHT